MYTAEKLGYTPYINWPDKQTPPRALQAYQDKEMFQRIPNMYDWYFEQPFITNPTSKDQIWTWESPGWGHSIQDEGFISKPLETIKEYYQKHLKFSKFTNAAGEEIVKKYNIDFSKTIGITWRGTDIYLDGRPRIPIETYFPFIDEILDENPDYRIMCTAEEEEILRPLLARYPQAFLIEEFFSSPHQSKHNPERLSDLPGFSRGLQPAVMVWLFSKCAHYIKNRSSTGAVASWLSSGRIVNLGHPETLGYENFPGYAQINGKLYPYK